VSSDPVLVLDDLSIALATISGEVPVVEHLSFSVAQGSTIALVGESGCGKSMTALAIMNLLPQGFRCSGGRILFEGEDLVAATPSRRRALRGNRMSMIFQEPMTALNPVFTVGEQIAEALRAHQNLGRRAAAARALDMLRAVQIPAAENRIKAYPHQLSGGMRQRVMIAIALACRPKLLIADEPTTALDVTVQAQVFDLLARLQEEMSTAIILITHDLGAVADIADDVAVLYAGRCIEQGATRVVMEQPLHPYTAGLMVCVPHLQPGVMAARHRLLAEIPGMVPPLGQRPTICAFSDRCTRVGNDCLSEPQPPLFTLAPTQAVACLHPLQRETTA